MNEEKKIVEEKGIVIQAPQDLEKPQKDTEFAHASAKLLVDIIKKNNWSKKLGGQSEHIQYEGWQTAGKYYGYLVKTYDAEYVEFGNTWGFKAKAVVVNENTGVEVGGAEAYCMNDEKNWGIDKYGKQKPKFQLASMAQTRAGSKALRQILGFVVALAGYNPSPLEEMIGEEHIESVNNNGNGEYKASEKQINFIKGLLSLKGYTREQLMQKYEVTNLTQLTAEQASAIISNLQKLPNKQFEKEEITDEDMDEIDKNIS